MYIPEIANDLSLHAKSKRIMLGVQGPAGSGKTTAALTFPNPLVLNWDRGLSAFYGRKDILEIPLYSSIFVKDICKITQVRGKDKLNYQAAALKVIKEYASKLGPDQTLVYDSWTSYQDKIDEYIFAEPFYTKKGGEDEWEAWQWKIDFSQEILDLLLELSCNIVVCFHELQERDKITGVLTDKLQPLQQGKFVTKIKIKFPFFFRQKALGDDKWIWQTKTDKYFDAKCQTPTDAKIPPEIPANYQELIKYL